MRDTAGSAPPFQLGCAGPAHVVPEAATFSLVATPPLISLSSLPAADVRPDLAIRLLAPQGLAQAAHIVAVGALLILLWGLVPAPALLVWGASVTITIAGRAWVTRWAEQHQPGFELLRRRVRWTVALTGLAWGVGAALLIPSLPFEDTMIIMATFAGLVAGGGSTFMADPVAFRLYSLSMLVPATASVLLGGVDRLHVIPAFLSLTVGAFMIRFNTQAYRALVDHLETRAALESALANIRTLGELLPICASCKKIRDDRGYWSQIEEYISTHSETSFSHGICPECIARLYPEFTTGTHPTQHAPGSS
jgi:hypothetical protein